MTIDRRQLLTALGATGITGALSSWADLPLPTTVPPYLHAYADAYRQDPHAAAMAWFKAARFGLFVHYNSKSLYGLPHKPTRADFTAGKFDADAIADLAVAAGMNYINFTPYHSGGPYLFRTETSADNTVRLLKRDLTAELAEACKKRKLGIFLYIHIAIGRSAPAVFARNQTILRELLTQYGPVAGIWFDSVLDYFRNPQEHPRLADHFSLVRSLQPQTLISFKQGATGLEDFQAPEHHPRPPDDNSKLSDAVKQKINAMPIEICTTLMLDRKDGTGNGMWFDTPDAYHRTPDEVIALLTDAASHKANLLLNTGLRGDGSIHPTDADTLRDVGRRIRTDGWPQ